MKKQNNNSVCIAVIPQELIAIRECLEMTFEKQLSNHQEKERIALLDLIFKNEYTIQMAMYIYEQIYDKIICIKISIFATELPVLKLTQIEVELLYILCQNIFDIEDLVSSLKNFSQWRHYDEGLINQLAKGDKKIADFLALNPSFQ